MSRKLTFRQKCKRCGAIASLEKHHKKHKTNGGSDANPNRIWHCTECHDYVHAKARIVASIKNEQERLAVLNKRLEILEALNTPDLIRERGYQSYFSEYQAPLAQTERCKT